MGKFGREREKFVILGKESKVEGEKVRKWRGGNRFKSRCFIIGPGPGSIFGWSFSQNLTGEKYGSPLPKAKEEGYAVPC